MQVSRPGRLAGLAVSFCLLGAGPRPAAAQLLGPEFPVNSYLTNTQSSPAVAVDGAGNFVVVWESNEQDGSGYGVFGQRFDAAGASVGSEFQVNAFTTNAQANPAVAADGAGNFVVVWEGDLEDGWDYGVFGQRFDSTGSALGTEFQVNSHTTGNQRLPAVAAASQEEFVVVWQSYNDQDGSGWGVFGQRFDWTGSALGSEFQVNSFTTYFQGEAAVAVDGSGNFVVVWFSYQQDDGSAGGIYGQRFDSAGNPAGSEFLVNTHTTDFQSEAAVAADGAGNFVVVWRSDLQDGSYGGVFGQRYDSAGAVVGGEFQVNSRTTNNQTSPAVAADSSGNFVVTWESYGQDGGLFGVFGQRFNSAGSRVGSELQVNGFTTSSQGEAAVAADGEGNFVVAWGSEEQDDDGEGVFGRQLRWLFSDGFEADNSCAWSAQVGSGKVCPVE